MNLTSLILQRTPAVSVTKLQVPLRYTLEVACTTCVDHNTKATACKLVYILVDQVLVALLLAPNP